MHNAAVATMRTLDGELAGRACMVGDKFTMADIFAMAGLFYADFAKIKMPVELTHLVARRAGQRAAECHRGCMTP